MKIGVIGAGNWGKNLVKNFTELGVLSGVADGIAANRDNALNINNSIEIYDNHHELLKHDYDAVAIATPAHTHYQIAKEAMEAGCHIFIEKPMTLDAEESQAIVALGKQHHKIIMVGHLLMYQPAITFIKEYLNSNQLGQIYSLHQRRSKLGRVRSVENVLWSFGVHDVAVLLYLIGDNPTDLQVSGHAGVQNHVEDDTYLHLNFKSGIKAHLHNSWLWPKTERELIITSEKGILIYDEIKQQVILQHQTIDQDLNHHDQGSELLFEGSGQPLKLELEHFIDCCKNGTQPISCGENGLAVVKVLAAAENILNTTRNA